MTNLQVMYERACRQFGLPYESSSAKQSFIDALNFALSELVDMAGWESQEADNLDDTISLSTSGERTVTKGINFYLTNFGYKPVSEEDNMFAMWRDAIRTARMIKQQES